MPTRLIYRKKLWFKIIIDNLKIYLNVYQKNNIIIYKMNYKEQSDKKTIFVTNIKFDKVDKKKKVRQHRM